MLRLPSLPRVLVATTAFALVGVVPAAAQTPPSPQDVLGWSIGERFTSVPDVERYFTALATASPLVTIEEYGRTWENRPLHQVVIASEEHRGRFDAILEANRELADPDTPVERAEEIARDNPAIVYFSYGVHGNESSSTEAALWTAWDLASGAPAVAGVLESVVVVIDPVVNPDGRNRYVEFYRGARGPEPDPDPATREHREPWPGGRTNHYYFDLNRDWTWLSQIETRSRLATWDRWTPQVHVDFHEMSANSSYFFFPPADPINPIYPEHVARWSKRIGDGNAAAFDAQGWLYFTEETYDLFYPGYGDSWPSLLGAIGMTYEQAGGGSAGLAYRRSDGDILTLTQRATQHRTAGQATLRTAAEGKGDLLRGFADLHRTVDEGHPDFLLVPGTEGFGTERLAALVDHLDAQGIRYEVASEDFESRATPHPGWGLRDRFPAGTVRVPARQPRGRLAVTLLQSETELDATYSYDVSAWALPYGYGVEAHTVDEVPDAGWAAPAADAAVASATGEPYGYLVRPGFHVWPALVSFLEEGGRGRVISESFTIGEDRYPRGTILLPRALNDDLATRAMAAGLGPWLEPVASAITDEGPDLGTGRAGRLSLPRVVLVGGEGTSSLSFGAHRYFLDHRLGLPHLTVNAEDLAGMDLEDVDVVVVPSAGGIANRVGDRGMEALEAWVRDGGTLVAVAGGASAMGRMAEVEVRPSTGPEEGERLGRALRTREERQLERWESQTPGTVLEVQLDPGHPLAFGAGAMPAGSDRMFVLSTGAGFEPSEDFESAAWFGDDAQGVSGVIGEETVERLRESSWLVQRGLGGGQLILFADDPLFRMMWYSGFQPYANALLLGPAF
ncbi:MAG: zinc carboxypeptidase [Gemmatimonadetes bacterium]|nr:zinc carboxypeptidase [Gemmatimonadota bacterium]